jgi:hypothetical protein
MILSSACRQWRADTHPTLWDEPWSPSYTTSWDTIHKRRGERTVLMKIGDQTKRSGLPAQTIRYFERIGLRPDADRGQVGQT